MFLQDSVHVCITNMLLSHVDKHTYDFCEDKIPIPSSSISCRMRAHFYERRSRRARIIMAAALRRECAVTRRLHGGCSEFLRRLPVATSFNFTLHLALGRQGGSSF